MIGDQREINGAVVDDQRVVASCVSVRNISHKDNAPTIYGLTLGDLYEGKPRLPVRRRYVKNGR